MNLSLIDIDSMYYMSCRDTLEESIETFKEKLNNCIEQTKADYWAGFVTSGKCFRYQLYPQYKSNRTRPIPKWFKALREWSYSEYNLVQCVDYEADDAAVYWYNKNIICGLSKYENGETDGLITFADASVKDYMINPIILNKTICAIDKDILGNVPGKMFNYTYRLEDKSNPDSLIKGWWVETSKNIAEYNKFVQILMGDSTDSVNGLNGIGIKSACKMVDSMNNFPEETLSRYISHYRSVSEGIYQFQLNYRLLHMLESDEDFMREVGHLPEFPKINKVNKVVKEVIDF